MSRWSLRHHNTNICIMMILSTFHFLFWPPGRQWHHLQILSYQKDQFSCLDTLNIKILPLFQILQAEPGLCNNFKSDEKSSIKSEEYSYIRGFNFWILFEANFSITTKRFDTINILGKFELERNKWSNSNGNLLDFYSRVW